MSLRRRIFDAACALRLSSYGGGIAGIKNSQLLLHGNGHVGNADDAAMNVTQGFSATG